MNRLNLYIIGFIFATITYVVLFKFFLVDSIVMIAFILATVAFIFTTEKQPEFEELLDEPKVHFYRKTRLNIYGYMMVISGVIIAFGFYIASTNSSIRIGILSLVLWLTLITIGKLMTMYIARIMFKDALYDFLLMQIEGLNDFEKSKELSNILEEYFRVRDKHTKKTSAKKSVSKDNDLGRLLKKSKLFTQDEVEDIIELALLYLEENSNEEDELVSDEIGELNRAKSKK